MADPWVGEPDIVRFELKIKMDATVTIHDSTGEAVHWIKPGSEVGVSWGGLPSETEVIARYEDLSRVASATLEAMIVQTTEQLRKAHRGEVR